MPRALCCAGACHIIHTLIDSLCCVTLHVHRRNSHNVRSMCIDVTHTMYAACHHAALSTNLGTMQSLGLHSIDAGSIHTAIVQPDGFAASPRVTVPPPGAPDTPIPLASLHQRGAATTCFLAHALHADPAGDHLLVITVPLWVFNCTSVPIALRPASHAEEAEDPLATPHQEHAWIMPYGGTGWAPHTASGPRAKVGPPGLEEIVEDLLAQREGPGVRGRGRPARLASFRSDAALSRSLEQHVTR